jgi:hypothetical protein
MNIVEIPVTAHIKKFCDAYFGNPIVLDDKSSDVVAMKVFLSYPMQLDLFFEHEPLQNLPNTILLDIKRRKFQHIFIKKQNLQQIVKFIDRIFEEELHRYVMATATQKSHTNGYKHQIEQFCNQYGIEIDLDISFDAIIKLYYRYRCQLGEKSPAYAPQRKALAAV